MQDPTTPTRNRSSLDVLGRGEGGFGAIAFGIASICFAVALLAGCASEGTSELANMPDGINDTFLDAELDVDQWVERFEGESRAVYAKRNEIVAALGLEPGDDIADIGAGTGFFSLLMADAVGPDGKVHAVEISPKFLEHLRGLAKENATHNLVVVEGTTTSVELARNSIDAAFICDVYHHFETPEASLASLRKALRPGGTLYLIDFHRIEGETPQWLFDHVRADRGVFQAEIESAGFHFDDEIVLEGLEDNYFLRFEDPD